SRLVCHRCDRLPVLVEVYGKDAQDKMTVRRYRCRQGPQGRPLVVALPLHPHHPFLSACSCSLLTAGLSLRIVRWLCENVPSRDVPIVVCGEVATTASGSLNNLPDRYNYLLFILDIWLGRIR